MIAPFFISYLMRIYAWQSLLVADGFINRWLLRLSVIDSPVGWLQGRPGVVILGLVYGYIPYMILPIYGQLDRIDRSMMEAGRDLGAESVRDVPAGHVAAFAAGDPRRARDRVAPDVRRLLHEQPARFDQDVDVREPHRQRA